MRWPALSRRGAAGRSRLLRAASLLLLAGALFAGLAPGAARAQTIVAENWGLKPSNVGVGNSFRLMFVTGSKIACTSNTVSTYDTFVQGEAAGGHSDIQTHSNLFKALVSTHGQSGVNARDHTGTTFTDTDKGIPIFWLGGNNNRVANNYQDLWNGGAFRSQARGPDGRVAPTHPADEAQVWTGSKNDGTKDGDRALGTTGQWCRQGSYASSGPISNSNSRKEATNTKKLYALSPVFRVTERPGKVTGVRVDQVRRNSIRVHWVRPSEASTVPITSYRIRTRSRNADDTGWESWVLRSNPGASDTSATITGLPVGVRQQVEVLARGTRTADNFPFSGVASTPLSFTTDAKAPVLSTTTPPAVDRTTLTLTYDEALDTNSVPGESAFTVKVDGHRVSLATSTPVAVSGSVVTLTLASAVTDRHAVTVSYSVPTGPGAKPIRDEASNNAVAFTDKMVTNDSPDTTPPVLVTPAVNGATLTLTYNEALDTNSVPGESAFTVKVDGVTRSLADTNPVAVSGSAVTLTLASAVTDRQAVTVSYSVPTGPGAKPIRDAADHNAAAFTDKTVTNDSPDTTPPMLVTSAVNGATLTLTYDEALDTSSVPRGIDFTVRVGGNFRDVSNVAISGRVVTLTLFSAVNAGQGVSMSYRPDLTPNPIQDLAGHNATSLSQHGVANVTGDTTAPALSTTTPPAVNGAVLTLTFDETLDVISIPAAGAFTVKADGRGVSLADAGPVAVGARVVTLRLVSPVTDRQAVTVSYTVPASNPVRDLAGNGAAAFSDRAAVNNTPDMSAPRLISALPPTVAGALLTLTWDEALDAAHEPAASAFAVKADGAPVTVTDVAVAGSAATLTLASAVTDRQAVTVSYTVPATGAIRDAAGNEAAGFTDRATVNATPGILLSTPSLTVAEGGSASYTARLTLQPSGEVTVTVARAAGGSGEVSFDTRADSGNQDTLTFTAMNWSTPQTVWVSAATDADTTNDAATLVHTARGGGYDAAAASLAVTVTDAGAPPASGLLVGNRGQADGFNTIGVGTRTVAQQFTTGPNPAGYRLSEVEWETVFGRYRPSRFHLLVLRPNPDRLLHTLVRDATGPGVRTYRAPASAVLTAGTSYFVVFKDHGGTTQLRATRSSSEDAGGASGWSIANAHRFRAGVGNWNGNSNVTEIAIRGAAVPDTTAPALSAAMPPSVTGATLTLTYDEALDPGSVPAASAFAVEVNGASVALTNQVDAAAVAIDGSTVTLSLANATVAGDTVTLDYTAPANNPIQDAAGNAAANLRDRDVINTLTPVVTDHAARGAGGDGRRRRDASLHDQRQPRPRRHS